MLLCSLSFSTVPQYFFLICQTSLRYWILMFYFMHCRLDSSESRRECMRHTLLSYISQRHVLMSLALMNFSFSFCFLPISYLGYYALKEYKKSVICCLRIITAVMFLCNMSLTINPSCWDFKAHGAYKLYKIYIISDL